MGVVTTARRTSPKYSFLVFNRLRRPYHWYINLSKNQFHVKFTRNNFCVELFVLKIIFHKVHRKKLIFTVFNPQKRTKNVTSYRNKLSKLTSEGEYSNTKFTKFMIVSSSIEKRVVYKVRKSAKVRTFERRSESQKKVGRFKKISEKVREKYLI